MSKVKHGVIGLGWFGEWHCDALAGLPNVELYSLCTRTAKRLKALGKKFGVKHLYTDYHEMLADPELEAVSITTMWDQHLGPALAALKAGKHVFLEKPMASTVAECRKIVAAAHATDKHFMVGHICRFNPRYAQAKEDIVAGKVGKVLTIHARRNIAGSLGASVLPKIGPIIGDGVHDMDLILWYTGAKVVSAYAQTIDVSHLKYPDIGWSMFQLDSGATAVLENCWRLPGQTPWSLDERMEIIGTEGSIHIHESSANYSIVDANRVENPDTTYWPVRHGARRGALREELDYFTSGILQGTPPTIITPEESLAAVEACLAAEKSAATGKIVKL